MLDNLKKNGSLKSSFVILIFISVIIFIAHKSWGIEENQAYEVWRFDYRDCFYDINYLNQEKAVIVGDRGRILVTHPKFKNLWSPRNSQTKELLTCVSFVDENYV